MQATGSLPQPIFKSESFKSAYTPARSEALCLSTAHIPRKPHDRHRLRVARGGYYAALSFGRAPGRVGGGGRRGHITEFSAASRRRLMVNLNSVDRSKIERPFFVTLTWHDSWPDTPAGRARQMDALLKRLEYEFGAFPAVWRVEFKTRLSGARAGEVAPHLHLLVFLPPEQILGGPGRSREFARLQAESRLRRKIAIAWNEIAAAGDVEHLKVATHRKSCVMVESWRGVNSYAAKYMAKLEKFDPGSAGIGRAWGIRRRGLLGIMYETAILTKAEAFMVRRLFRRYSGTRYRNHRGDLQSASCFVSYSTMLRLLAWLGHLRDGMPLPDLPAPVHPEGASGPGAWAGRLPRVGSTHFAAERG